MMGDQLHSNRPSAVLHRVIDHVPETAVRGEGIYVFNRAGKRYLDASGGAAVSCLGHSDGRVIAAIQQQVAQLPFAHTSFFTSAPSEKLARRLVDNAPLGFGEGRVAFLGSGSEAVEAALKLARQYFVEKGEMRRTRFISRRMSYHGNTLGALAVGGHFARRRLYQPLLMETSQIAPCYAYRGREAGESDTTYGLRVADELAVEIERLGPENVAGFIAEPVAGATLGSVPPTPCYFARIREICDHYGVLLIADEVMCGIGRCGTLFAMAKEGAAPDLITIAKGLGAGYQAISAVMACESLVGVLSSGSGVLANGHTYMNHAVACAASLAVLEAIESDALLDSVGQMGAYLEQSLLARFADHPFVGDIRGRGLFWSLELVADRHSKKPFSWETRLSTRIKSHGLDKGLICYPSSGTADGLNGDHVLLAPPFIIQRQQIDEIVEKLSATLDAAFKGTN